MLCAAIVRRGKVSGRCRDGICTNEARLGSAYCDEHANGGEESKFSMVFGAAATAFGEQLAASGIKHELSASDVRHFQRDLDAVVRLHVRGLLRDSDVKRFRLAVFKKIVGAIEGKK